MHHIKSIYTRYIHDVIIAAEAILANKVKALLTALGIMFGVAAVISMLAIGKGAQQEVLEQIKMIGINNIIITPHDDSKQNENANNNGHKRVRLSKGLNLQDIDAITEVIPTVFAASPIIKLPTTVLYNGRVQASEIIGVLPSYFKALNIQLKYGRIFTQKQAEQGDAVCVIGAQIHKHFFNNSNPIGHYIKCGNGWLKVIGVIDERLESTGTTESNIGLTDLKVLTPAKTILMRYQNKGKINPDIMEGMTRGGAGFFIENDESSYTQALHQLDKIIIQVTDAEQLEETAEIINRLLLRRHGGNKDFKITVPELLLKQQQKTNDIFNIVLGAIAGISLVVGGIGIMNIMLASVWERIKEIGTRQAIGATKKDITVQFLAESVLISVTGGVIGIILGVFMAYLIDAIADINTIVSLFSVTIAFVVSVSVGILFGYLPAIKAAQQSPVESLRH